jgi:murein DD-endopeptidase MepM/ murein hydrolase activator NlpD
MASRRKSLSVLLIPEGEQQTFSIKIRYGILKAILVSVVLFFIVLTIGMISYWKLMKVSLDYNRLADTNETLIGQNATINDIALKYLDIQEIDKRIRSIFGEIQFPEDESMNSIEQFAVAAKNNYANPSSAASANRGINPFLRPDLLNAYPTAIPAKGEFTQNFSSNDAVTGSGHSGIDITAKEGSIVSAAGDGIVVFSNWTVDSGYQIIIDHQNGYISVYKHNASLLVKARDFISQNEPIALVGNSGTSSAPHLHYEIWKNFLPIDPKLFWSIQ